MVGSLFFRFLTIVFYLFEKSSENDKIWPKISFELVNIPNLNKFRLVFIKVAKLANLFIHFAMRSGSNRQNVN